MQNQSVFKIRIQAAQLPPGLANDAYLDIEPVEAAPPATEVLHLKAERVEQPANDNTDPAEESRLKAERIEQPSTAAASARPNKRR